MKTRRAARNPGTPARSNATAEALALGTYTKLTRAADAVTERIHKPLRHENLTLSQFGVLEAIYHLGPLCQKDLAGKILKSAGNLTTVIDNLVRRELVKREPDPADRRRHAVALTPAGRKLIGRLFPPHAARVAQECSVLTPAELRVLAELLRRLGQGRA